MSLLRKVCAGVVGVGMGWGLIAHGNVFTVCPYGHGKLLESANEGARESDLSFRNTRNLGR